MLRLRILTALVAVPALLLVLFAAPAPVARVAIALLFVAAAIEWSQFLGVTRTQDRWLFTAVIVAGEILIALAVPPASRITLVFGAAILWWLAATVWAFRYPTPVPGWLRWAGGLLVLLPAYAAMDWLYARSPSQLLGLLVLVWLADIGAYAAGRTLGRRKLAPAISPGKTWEGVLGGVLVPLAAALVAAFYLGYDPGVSLALVLVVVLVSIVGDLTVSMFKRSVGLKDSGKLLPGHGGVLDRIDSVCAAAPVFAAGLAVFGPP